MNKLEKWWKNHWDETVLILGTTIFILWLLRNLGRI